ncbi:sigma-54-dependent Fis family transcriptional regulator [Trichlorobacter lovleyi]|uniref:sigma-54-dependent transcriptional regulator n=1 Tax=Trichlorobacter lovleyi TaxID=313985 RepID=UPI00223F7A2B|nr:sigma-54 dependent transcriptional regulator [Trichlorobacter lovleyi]QOX79942.1 sigma-54-dependent Fis family transcriptional regulator [Trichlorobacter lovleyi]
MSKTARILLVEDDATFRSLLAAILDDEGYELVEREDGKAALKTLQRQSFDLVLSDLRLPGLNGLDLFRRAQAEGIAPPFVLLTAFGTVEEAVAAMKEGVADFLTKPLKDPDTLRLLVRRILAGSMQERSLHVLQERDAAGLPPDEVLFAGQAMQQVRKLIGDVAATQATVLISGESGTGKELAARMIHRASPRRDAPFVALNCAAIPETLLESELFGHEKGAFTGATQARQGKFELASGGTLFLDEIGELPLALQSKFLRVLQERVFERVGGSRELRADVRVIAATNRDLGEEVRERRFREDLYYRLHVFPIHLPALRDRRDGLTVLVQYLLQRAAIQTGREVQGIEPQALAAVAGYGWPGNIRELQNVIERAVILCKGQVTVGDLPDGVRQPPAAAGMTKASGSLRDRERNDILDALASCGNNRRLAAEKLGISKRTLQYRLKEYGLVKP